MNISKLIIISLGIVYSLPIYSQQKMEREYSINPSAVPQKAREFIERCYPVRNIKWYGEESHKSRSIEAKFKKGSKSYSIEFDSLGNLQDAEVLVSFASIPDSLRKLIESKLSDQFRKYKIMKVQRQWKGPVDALQALITEQKAIHSFETNYEIIIRGVNEKGTALYELLFNQEGTLARSLQIVQQNASHLIY